MPRDDKQDKFKVLLGEYQRRAIDVGALYHNVRTQFVNQEALALLERLEKQMGELQTYKMFEGAEDLLIDRQQAKAAIQKEKGRYEKAA